MVLKQQLLIILSISQEISWYFISRDPSDTHSSETHSLGTGDSKLFLYKECNLFIYLFLKNFGGGFLVKTGKPARQILEEL